MAQKLVASVDVSEPEVVMEIEVLEISHNLAEQLGINYPANVSFSATKPGNSKNSSVSGLVLSDLAKQSANTIAVSSLGVSVDLTKTVGAANLLSSPRVRARNKEKAKILVGNRVPVVTSGTSATTGGSFSTSNVQYIDVGLTLEVQPTVRNDGNVAIKIALEVSSIVKQVSVPIGNGATTLAYEIGTRNTSTLLQLRDGETQVLAGLIQDIDQRNSTHIPGLGDLPILGRLFGSDGTTRDKNEIVMSITPRIIRAQPRPSSETTEFWYGSETQTRSAPFTSGAAGAEGSGGVSFGAGGTTTESAPAPRAAGPRAPPERLKSSAAPPPAPRPSEPPAPADAVGATPPPPPPDGAADAAPRVTIEGPETAKIGDEVGVVVRLSSTAPVGRIRTQVGFDASALQLVSAEPGELARSGEPPKIETRPGGVQLDLGSGDAPLAGNGTLVELRFRVVAARPAIAVTSQVVLVGQDGAAVAATQATPLRIAVAP
jgi:general secretion pathway protein D